MNSSPAAMHWFTTRRRLAQLIWLEGDDGEVSLQPRTNSRQLIHRTYHRNAMDGAVTVGAIQSDQPYRVKGADPGSSCFAENLLGTRAVRR